MLNRKEIEALIPHKGAMCLLDRVEAWDASSIRLATLTHRDANNPLRSRSGLRSLVLCEYSAQAMAVHGVLQSNKRNAVPSQGLLASLRAVKLYCNYIDQLPGELIVHAEYLNASDTLLQYGFRVTHENVLLIEGRAVVVIQPSK
jgi:predicted hotdog family 3-hydroxylacyl-ACP dehydratase